MNMVQNQVCTREQAVFFKQAGLMQESLLFHYQSSAISQLINCDGWTIGTRKDAEILGIASSNMLSAYNVGELGAMLCRETKYCYYHKPSHCWGMDRIVHSHGLFTSQAQCYAAILKELMEIAEAVSVLPQKTRIDKYNSLLKDFYCIN